MFRQVLRLFAICLLSISMTHPVHASGKLENRVLVTRLDGTAVAITKSSPSGVAIKKSDWLSRDTEVRIGEKSRIELKFPDGTIMRLAENTHLKLNEVSYEPNTGSKDVRVDLSLGRLWAKVKKLVTADSKVEVKTVNAVAGVRGTVYRVNVEEDKSALVRVYDGSVYVSGLPREVPKPATQVSGPVPVAGPHEVPPPYREVSMEEWHAIVKSFQQITISAQGTASKPQDFDPKEDAKDDWVKWNQELDRQMTF